MATNLSRAWSGEEVAVYLKTGDPRSVQIVRERVRRILGFRAYGIPAHVREDLEQDVMTEVWRAVNRSGFDTGGGFWGFIETVTARRCIDWLRTRRRVEELPESLEDVKPGPLDDALSNERIRLAHATLSHLDSPCRQLIYLLVGLEKSYSEIGALLGKTEGSLRVQLYRCIRAARVILDRIAQDGKGLQETKAGRA